MGFNSGFKGLINAYSCSRTTTYQLDTEICTHQYISTGYVYYEKGLVSITPSKQLTHSLTLTQLALFLNFEYRYKCTL